MYCELKSSKVNSSQRTCIYACKDKSMEGRITEVDSKCAQQIVSYY
jgi:hypothetical protein